MKRGLLLSLSIFPRLGMGATPHKMFYQCICLGRFLCLAVNNSILNCPKRQGDDDIIHIWGWLRVRYKSGAKLDILEWFYRENIRLLEFRRFQELAILYLEIDGSADPGEQLIIQMVEHIKELIFTGPYKTIKNWFQEHINFRDAVEMLLNHTIIRITAQTKRAIKDEVNRILLGKSYAKR